MKDLAGRTAIVTGASRGLGPHIARALAREGMELVLTARSHQNLEDVARRLRDRGARVTTVAADITLPDGRAEVFARALEAHGGVDVLVNNAGIELANAFHEAGEEELHQVVGINLLAPMLMTRLVLPHMLERRTGHVVNLASLAGKAPVPFNAPYAATKFGIIGFTQSLRTEFAGSGVSFSTVSPGFVEEAGMFADAQERSPGLRATRVSGASKPRDVAKGVVTAIKKNRVDVIVNPYPMRPMFAVRELAPGLVIRLIPLFGVPKVMQAVAKSRTDRRD